MYYLFRKDGTCFGEIDYEPCSKDMASRDEYFIESDSYYEDFTLLVGDKTADTITVLPEVYEVTNYGEIVDKVKISAVEPAGAVRFTTEPTADQLKTAFPALAGSRAYTITKDGVVGDTITISGCTVTLAGSAPDVSLNTDKAFSAIFKATLADSVLTVTEIIKGNGNTPSAATTTGTLAITSADPVTSVYGYTTAEFTKKLISLEAVHEEQQLQNIRAAMLAELSGGTTEKHKEDIQNLETWFNEQKEALINEQ